MKKIIIIGVCLVTAAIVYGFVDYLKTDKKQLQRMYSDDPATDAPAALKAHPVGPVAAPVENTVVVQASKTSESNPFAELNTKLRRKKVNLKLYSRAALEEKYIAPDTMAAVVTPVVKKIPAPSVVPLQKKLGDDAPAINFKKVDLRLFSRAPLRKMRVVADTVNTSVTGVQAAKKKL